MTDFKAFVRELALVCWDGGSLDAVELQDMMVKHGLLLPVEMKERCGESCFCAEEYGEEAFPLTCMKLAPEWA